MSKEHSHKQRRYFGTHVRTKKVWTRPLSYVFQFTLPPDTSTSTHHKEHAYWVACVTCTTENLNRRTLGVIYNLTFQPTQPVPGYSYVHAQCIAGMCKQCRGQLLRRHSWPVTSVHSHNKQWATAAADLLSITVAHEHRAPTGIHPYSVQLS